MLLAALAFLDRKYPHKRQETKGLKLAPIRIRTLSVLKYASGLVEEVLRVGGKKTYRVQRVFMKPKASP